MSKIVNVRLPNPSAEYDAEKFNQLIRSLEQIVLQLNTAYTVTVSEDKDQAHTYGGGGCIIITYKSRLNNCRCSTWNRQ